jgi:ketosteroid isomerase-like protein
MKAQILIGILGFFAAAAAAEEATATVFGCPVGEFAQQLADRHNAQWTAAMRARDSSRLAALYAENAILMPPTDETIVGRAPIAAYLTSGNNTAPLANYSVDIIACDIEGDSLSVAGVWGAEQTDYRGQAIAMTGNVLRVLDRQTDGTWSLRYEIWN